MRYLILILCLFLTGAITAQREINKPDSKKYYLAYDSISGVYHLGSTLPNQVTTSGQPYIKQSIDELGFLQSTDHLDIPYDTLPGIGESVDSDRFYRYQGKLLLSRGPHQRSELDTLPENDDLKYITYRQGRNNLIRWRSGDEAYVGQYRWFGNTKYECAKRHTTSGQTVPNNSPTFWIIPGANCPEWQEPLTPEDEYSRGDCVFYLGQEWISTIDSNYETPGIAGWTEN